MTTRAFAAQSATSPLGPFTRARQAGGMTFGEYSEKYVCDDRVQSTAIASTGPSKAMKSRHGSALAHEPT